MRNTLIVAACSAAVLAAALSPSTFDNPKFTQAFEEAIGDLHKINDHQFGTATGRNIKNLSDLAGAFQPYGIAGTTVINQEWQRYQTFNPQNFVFTPNALNLTAILAGGLYSGGIKSGQIFSNQLFKPGATGYNTYAFEVRMKIPSAPGAWPATWFYAKTNVPVINDGSEIDVEFFNMKNQNHFDWTGFNHGPQAGADIYSIMTNKWVWHPGIDFSADYHNYQTTWTPTAVYKYVDGKLIRASNFQYTSNSAANLIVNLAVGTDNTTGLPGLQPTSTSDFPMVLSVDHITIWAR